MNETRLPNQSDQVDRFMDALDHPHKAEVAAVRTAMLASNPRITEHIKWKAPSFGYDGEDRVTFRLQPPTGIHLIFHRGAKVKEIGDFAFADDTGLMRWVTADRAVVTLQNIDDGRARLDDLISLVNRWLDATE